ncbi:MAG TPA: alpha/beta fold hydrolase [Candidatus Saccharimonadales bacterium]
MTKAAQVKRLLIGLVTGLVGVSGGLLLATPVLAAESNHAPQAGFCISHTVPVALAPGQPFNKKVYGTYCQPFHWAKGQHQLDVLVHGTTYSSTYWDWPQDPALYSYVDKTLAAGRATFAYDRIGSGKSSIPVSTDVTMPSSAYVLHELIQGFRLLGYKQINSIGHSMGSGVVMREAATYNDPNRVVLTGYLHAGRNPAVVAAVYQANLDPLFAGRGLDNGYLTSTPGGKSVFYSSSADPAVVAYDEAHKDIASGTFFGDYIADRAVPAGANLANQVKAPVLLIAGQQDQVFCFSPGGLDCTNQAGVQANEAPYYTGAASFTLDTVPDTGHDLALHPSANSSFAMINGWIHSH